MRTLAAVLIGMALLPAVLGEKPGLPTVSVDMVTFGEVRRASEVGTAMEPAESPGTLLVERPVHAVEGMLMGVFVVSDDGVLLRRAVTYGRASGTLQVVSGVAPSNRVVVSDMSAWDAFDRLRMRR